MLLGHLKVYGSYMLLKYSFGYLGVLNEVQSSCDYFKVLTLYKTDTMPQYRHVCILYKSDPN